MRSDAERLELERRTEKWFVRRGLPHFIDGYSATSDIFTRASGFLIVVFVFQLLNAVSDTFEPWQNALALLGSVAIAVATLVSVNWLRGRPRFRRPDTVGPIELTVFVLVPPLAPLLLGGFQAAQALVVAIGQLVTVGIVFVVTSYGLVPMTRWAIGQMVHQIRNVTNLFVRSLPLLLLFTMFMFFNAELWKITDDIPPLFFWIAMGILVAVGSAFVLLRIPRELRSMAAFDSWSEIVEISTATPVEGVGVAGLADPPGTAPLTRRGNLNIALVLFASQSIQILLVTATIGLFYVLFGMFTIVPSTVEQWTGSGELDTVARWMLGGGELVISGELIRTAIFIATVAGLQFTVAALTDSTYREEFYGEISTDIRRALAVRAVYLERLVDPEPVAAATGDEQGPTRRGGRR